ACPATRKRRLPMSARPATSKRGDPPPASASRRDFLKAGGAVGAAGLLAACVGKQDPYARAQDKAPVPGSDSWYLGEERFLATSCAQCPVDCGIKVRVVEGRAVK